MKNFVSNYDSLLKGYFELPMECQLILIALLGLILGAFVNWAVDHFAWTPRYRSPWRHFPQEISNILQRRFVDFIPVFGWFSMIRFNRILFVKQKSKTKKQRKKCRNNAFNSNQTSNNDKHFSQNNATPSVLQIAGMENGWFWVRPLFVECGLSIFLVWFYQYKMTFFEMPTVFENNSLASVFFIAFLIQTFLIVLMLIASLIDFDDYIIPDLIVIPGTVFGILLMTFFFHSELFFNVRLDSISLFNQPRKAALFYGTSKAFWTLFGCWTLWAFALLDRRWYSKLSRKKRILIFLRSLKRSLLTPILLILWIIGIGFLYCICSPCWTLSDHLNSEWEKQSQVILKSEAQNNRPFNQAGITGKVPKDNLILSDLIRNSEKQSFFEPFSSLTDSQSVALKREIALFHAVWGLTIGLLLIWSVRLMGKWILKREAMGFGDVTLLGMIGVFVGWRGTIIVFFLAPFAGLIFGLFRLLFRTEREIPYGPFLCLATLVVLTELPILEFVFPLFIDSETLLLISGMAAVLFLVLLLILQGIKRLLFLR
ncbi:MAG: A24 family peptidase [Planctomycetia bacterium]|nr:A24 family peptidase [Planctomycetia bacterium]